MRGTLQQDIIDALPHALLVLDERLRVIVSNRACDLLLVKPAGTTCGLSLADILPHRDLLSQTRAAIETGGTRVVEFLVDIGKGITKVLRATGVGLEQNRPAPSRRFCLIVLEDVGERVRLEEQLVQSEKLAGMGLLASSVAHELGTPLTIMSSTLQYVQSTLVDVGNNVLTEAIEAILDSVGQMRGILRSLSHFTGLQGPRFASTDLSRVLSQMLGFVCAEAERHNIRIHHQLEDRLPPCLVDPGEIKQLLLNLFKNAIEAMPEGGDLHVKMRSVPKVLAETEDHIRLEVSDTGIGMSEGEMRSIFRTFYSTKPGNTGLGLPLCRRIVEEHGGEIIASSRPGEGSTFIVTLPVRLQEEP